MKKKTIVIGSYNPGKIKEMTYYLKKTNFKILLAENFKLNEPEENGQTFEKNALIKARYVNKKKINAYYISVLAISWNRKKEKTFTGKIFGRLIWPPRGKLGFGYDPIFMPNGYSKTFGEIERDIKNKISHRAIAFKKFMKFLS